MSKRTWHPRAPRWASPWQGDTRETNHEQSRPRGTTSETAPAERERQGTEMVPAHQGQRAQAGGKAKRVTDNETLERVVAVYREGGWPVEVEGDAFTAPFTHRAPARRLGISTGSPLTPLSASRAKSHTAPPAGGSGVSCAEAPPTRCRRGYEEGYIACGRIRVRSGLIDHRFEVGYILRGAVPEVSGEDHQAVAGTSTTYTTSVWLPRKPQRPSISHRRLRLQPVLEGSAMAEAWLPGRA